MLSHLPWKGGAKQNRQSDKLYMKIEKKMENPMKCKRMGK